LQALQALQALHPRQCRWCGRQGIFSLTASRTLLTRQAKSPIGLVWFSICFGFGVSLLWVRFNLVTNGTPSLLHRRPPLSLQSKYLSRTSWPSAREGQTSIPTQLWSLTLFHILPYCAVKPKTLSSPHQINIESTLTRLQIIIIDLDLLR